MAAGGLLHLWNKWGIQIMVLFSFLLQVFLLLFAGIRRRKSSTILKISLWLAYLLADFTAIYALGHLSVASMPQEHRLVAFWAPFLLLHLGGPDNITAYALEDNRLWLRHLQALTVQVLGAAYVIYKFIGSSETFLLVASISMFVAGVMKYGERIWALKSSNMSSEAAKSEDRVVDPRQLLRQGMGEEEILLRAHSQFEICKCAFTDTKLEVGPKRPSPDEDDCIGSIAPKAYADEDVYKLVQMELSLMYDILYTKAAVIHTLYGFCIHFISLLGTAIAFQLFQLRSRNGQSRVDVIISYVLLVGALVLETISLVRVLLSTWTCASLSRGGWHCLLRVATFLRRHFIKPARRRLWSGSIGQYNLFHLCTRDRNEIGSRLATKLGLQNWWNKLHFSGTFSDTTSFSTEDLKKVVLLGLKDRVADLNPRGTFIKDLLREPMGGIDDEYDYWCDNMELDESIIVLHTATDVYLRETPAANEEKLIEATKVLSNYMMFLLVVKPEMLPGRARHKVYLDGSNYLDGHGSQCLDGDSVMAASPRSSNPYCACMESLQRWRKELFHHEGPNGSRIPLREKLADRLFKKYKDGEDGDAANSAAPLTLLSAFSRILYFNKKNILGPGSEAPYYGRWSNDYTGEYGFLLAKGLLEKESRLQPGYPDVLATILGAWVNIMLYAAERCSRDSHARQISNGGEFITIVWLVAQHLNYLSRHLNN
ncbi:hypothetical protein ACP4OV_029123 [Aristida adscensionis]